jgi:hypothetical protein
MNLPGKLRQIVRTALLGPLVPSQAFDLSLNAPQTEVAVWLHLSCSWQDCHHRIAV